MKTGRVLILVGCLTAAAALLAAPVGAATKRPLYDCVIEPVLVTELRRNDKRVGTVQPRRTAALGRLEPELAP